MCTEGVPSEVCPWECGWVVLGEGEDRYFRVVEG